MSQTVGRYQILEKIGQGGMGVVYKALDPLLQRTVAVKLIGDVVTSDPESRERFLREARAAGKLAHKNIITIHDLGEDEGRLYLAMEYLVGTSLATYLHRGRPSLARALDFAIDVCRGLEYAHRNGIVHRDIKPANLFLTDSGEVKVLDFGLARLVTSSLTRSQSVMGTVNYMAPEQVRGERIDQRADLFSMGAVLYELLVGRKAFEADSFASTIFKILEHEPERVESRNPAVPAELSAIVSRALAKRAEDRYQSAGDLLRDLAACRQSSRFAAADLDDTALPTSVLSSVASAARGDRAAQTGSVAWSPRRVRTTAVVGVLLVAGFLSSYFWGPASREEPASSESVRSEPAVATPPATTRDSAPPAPAVAAPAPVQIPQTPAPPTNAQRPSVTVDTGRATDPDLARRAAERGALEEAISRTGRTRASAESADAAALASAPYRAAVALQLEAEQLSTAGRLTEALTRAVEADARFRASEIEARAETAARERLRPAETPPPARPPAPEPRPETPVAVDSPRGEPRTPARGAEAVVQPANPEGAIRDLIAQYVSGLESRNLGALKRIWPSLTGNQERAIRAEFGNARAVQARFTDPRITINGDTATITGIREYNLVTQDGQKLSTLTRTTITVHRNGDAWIIDRVVHRQ